MRAVLHTRVEKHIQEVNKSVSGENGNSPGPFLPHAPGHILTSGLSVLLIFSVQLTVLRVLLMLRRRGRGGVNGWWVWRKGGW